MDAITSDSRSFENLLGDVANEFFQQLENGKPHARSAGRPASDNTHFDKKLGGFLQAHWPI